MNNSPKISIVTPTYNAEKMIEACLKSVVDQTYDNKEHLIIDGQSQDRTLEIVKKYVAKYPHIKWVSEKDGGIYDAMNKGINMSEGDWIYFMGSDDTFYNNQVLDDIFKREDIDLLDVIYGDVLWGDSGKTYDGEFTLTKLVEKNICHQAIFFKKYIFDKLDNFDVKYKSLADWAFNLRWFSDTKIKRKYIPLVISHFRLGGFSALHHDKIFFENLLTILEKNFPAEHVDAYKGMLSLKEGLNQRINNEESLGLSDIIHQRDQEISDLNQAIRQKDKVIRERDNKISLIKSSKFWKLRSLYLKFKKSIKF